jgi:eukaryotic-like serine/threonine-protein kinase
MLGTTGGEQEIMYRGNLQNTGVHDTRAASYFGEQPNWVFEAPSPITCSPVVAAGLVFVGTEDGNLFAIDIYRGIERWRFHLGRSVYTPPEIAGGRVFCMNRAFCLSAIDAQTGTEVPLGGHLFNLRNPSPPAIVEQVMYISDDSGYYALDMATGEIIRSFDREGFGNKRPVVGNGIVSFSGDTWVEVFGLENGAPTHTRDSVESLFEHEICLHDSSLYFFVWMGYHMTDDPEALPRSLFRYAMREGFERNYLELPQDSRTAPAAEDGIIYFGGDRGLYAIDIQAAAVRWEFTAGAPIQSSPSLAEDLIYFGSDDGALYVLNKDTGALVQRLPTASGLPVRTSPALWDGAVYFADTGGSLYSWGSAVDLTGINKTVIV